MRRLLPRALVLGAVIVLAVPVERGTTRAAERIERTPQLFILRVPGAFDDVLTAFLEEIKRRNYVVTGVNHLDDTLARRAAELGTAPFGYERYKIVGFCNLTLAGEALRASPYVGALMPCRAVVFKVAGSRETTIAAVRPSLARFPGIDDALARIVEQAEADIVRILNAVAGD